MDSIIRTRAEVWAKKLFADGEFGSIQLGSML